MLKVSWEKLTADKRKISLRLFPFFSFDDSLLTFSFDELQSKLHDDCKLCKNSFSLFAEALEIMNIKAKLNVFLAFWKHNRIFINRVAFAAKQIAMMGKSRCSNEIMCHLSSMSSFGSSMCNLKTNTNKSRKLISFSPRRLMRAESTQKRTCAECRYWCKTFIYIKRRKVFRGKNEICWH